MILILCKRLFSVNRIHLQKISGWHHGVLHQNENYAERYIWEKAVASSIKVFLLKKLFWKSQNGLAVGPRSPLSTLFPATVKSFDIEKNYMLKDLELFPCITWVNNLHISCETFAPRTHSVSFLWNQSRRNKKGARPLFQFLLRFIFDHFTLYQKKQPESSAAAILLLFYQWIGTNIPSMKQGFFCETKMYASERSHKALWSVSWVPLILGHPSFSQSFVLIYMHYSAFKSIDEMLRKQSA